MTEWENDADHVTITAMRGLRVDPMQVLERAEPQVGFRVGPELMLETLDERVRVRRSLDGELSVGVAEHLELERGDVIWRGRAGWVIDSGPTWREPTVEARAIERWDEVGPWGVLADRLLDHGDALGARLSAALGQRSSRPIAPHTWIGASWHHGVLRRVAITRPEWAAAVPWREALLELLVSPFTRFLEELALDLPRLEPDATADELLALGTELLALPWPRWLTRLHFGTTEALTLLPPQRLLDEAPRLPRTSLFRGGDRAELVLETASDLLAVEGLTPGGTPLAEGLRVRVFPSKVLFEKPAWPRYDSWPSWDFAFHEGRWFLSWRHGAPRSDEVKINGMEFFTACLVPGDRIEIGPLTLRFDLR